MRPFFTVHAGEYLVGSEIERQFKQVNVWVPSRDTGIDLLMSNRKNRRTVSVQVKFSKDFLPHMKPSFKRAFAPVGGGRLTETSSKHRQRTIGCLCC